eukprot:CAMPEP_0202811654 /NCGR_PEP_ID=MMETSP1389-20130828/3464_1 /ASSEMBLY_ACC=CAM_ASM_000865 /TAXON_ID=302021 /ORGANISM="Rhodomonas sp., Strain CCMP768" /LENGTH=500 /DNA_ID=CAMNT_0049482841 /DNA_START=84 /DNA_END=1587 /DNA_ORIENTATION=+
MHTDLEVGIGRIPSSGTTRTTSSGFGRTTSAASTTRTTSSGSAHHHHEKPESHPFVFVIYAINLGLTTYFAVSVGLATDNERETIFWKLMLSYVVIWFVGFTCVLKSARNDLGEVKCDTSTVMLALGNVMGNDHEPVPALLAAMNMVVSIWVTVVGWNKSCDAMNVAGHLCASIEILRWLWFVVLCLAAFVLANAILGECCGACASDCKKAMPDCCESVLDWFEWLRPRRSRGEQHAHETKPDHRYHHQDHHHHHQQHNNKHASNTGFHLNSDRLHLAPAIVVASRVPSCPSRVPSSSSTAAQRAGEELPQQQQMSDHKAQLVCSDANDEDEARVKKQHYEVEEEDEEAGPLRVVPAQSDAALPEPDSDDEQAQEEEQHNGEEEEEAVSSMVQQRASVTRVTARGELVTVNLNAAAVLAPRADDAVPEESHELPVEARARCVTPDGEDETAHVERRESGTVLLQRDCTSKRRTCQCQIPVNPSLIMFASLSDLMILIRMQ